jgi:hypothetical protein
MVKNGVHNLGFHGVIGSRSDRVIGPGKQLSDLCCKGSRVQFKACKTPVYASWFKLKRARKEFVWQYVISTRAADGETIRRWGRSRWRIEAFFKTLKFGFGLDQFGRRATYAGRNERFVARFDSSFWGCWHLHWRSGRRSRPWQIGRCWIGVWWRALRRMSWCLRFRRWLLNGLWIV